jgi:hypothetical protein
VRPFSLTRPSQEPMVVTPYPLFAIESDSH